MVDKINIKPDLRLNDQFEAEAKSRTEEKINIILENRLQGQVEQFAESRESDYEGLSFTTTDKILSTKRTSSYNYHRHFGELGPRRRR